MRTRPSPSEEPWLVVGNQEADHGQRCYVDDGLLGVLNLQSRTA